MDSVVCGFLFDWCWDLFCAIRIDGMTNRVKSTIYLSVFASVCFINKLKFINVENVYIKNFINGYLNDILGVIVFMLYLSIVLSFTKKDFIFKLVHVESIILISGILWEYVTPLYRNDTVSDPIDILAYLFGGALFWYICDGHSLMNDTT